MLDLIGKTHIIDNVIAYKKSKDKEEIYKTYITDCLQYVVQKLGAKNVKRWYDVIHPAKKDSRTPQEIANEIILKSGIKVVRKDERINANGDAGH